MRELPGRTHRIQALDRGQLVVDQVEVGEFRQFLQTFDFGQTVEGKVESCQVDQLVQILYFLDLKQMIQPMFYGTAPR